MSASTSHPDPNAHDIIVVHLRASTAHGARFDRNQQTEPRLAAYAHLPGGATIDVPLTLADLWAALSPTPATALAVLIDPPHADVAPVTTTTAALELAQRRADDSLTAQTLAQTPTHAHVTAAEDINNVIGAGTAAGIPISIVALGRGVAPRAKARRRPRSVFDGCEVDPRLLSDRDLSPDDLAPLAAIAIDWFGRATIPNLHPNIATNISPRGLGNNDGWAIAASPRPHVFTQPHPNS